MYESLMTQILTLMRVTIMGEEIPVTIATPHFPTLQNLSILTSINMKENLKQKVTLFKFQTEDQESGLFHLLNYLENNTTDYEDTTVKKKTKPGCDSLMKLDYYLYNRVLSELKQLASEHIVECQGDLREVTLRTVDVRGVEHRLVVELPPQYPSRRPTVVDVDLPEVALVELSQAESVLEMFNIFQTLVDSFQEFWNTYDILTKNTWLIDPEHPRYRDTHCRIMIGENISMLVTMNPQDVNTCPDIKFLGPESEVTPFINSMEIKLKNDGWDEDMSVCDNLLSLLGLTHFPRPTIDSETAPQQDECSICFMLRLPDQALPTKVCNNVKCNSFFHISCLAQWFQAVPTNETSFNLISGDCPCCGERILCPIKMT